MYFYASLHMLVLNLQNEGISIFAVLPEKYVSFLAYPSAINLCSYRTMPHFQMAAMDIPLLERTLWQLIYMPVKVVTRIKYQQMTHNIFSSMAGKIKS